MAASNPAGESVEGNVTEIDLSAHFFILEDRQAKPFIKVFWTAALEGPADNLSYVFKKIRKLQPGFFAAPLVTLEENTGGLQEGILIDLPWKDRPADFPRPQKKGAKGGGGYVPKNDKAIIHEVTYQELHATFRQWLVLQVDPVSFDQLMTMTDTIFDRAKTHAKAMCESAGVQ